MKLLIIEDNPRLADRIIRKLGSKYFMDVAESGHEGIQKLKKHQSDLVILDLGLPDMTGVEACERIRQFDSQIPILILTGNDDIEMRVKALDHGADDYILKPFNADELRAHIDALLRRRNRNTLGPDLVYGDLVINTQKRTATRAGIDLHLRRKEFDILEYLISNSGRVLTREMIMNHAWDGDKVGWTSTVDVHIKHLRDKVDRPFDTPIIHTAYGLGYKVESL